MSAIATISTSKATPAPVDSHQHDATANAPWWTYAVLIAWCGLLFVWGIFAGDLYRTEGLRALIAQDMLRSGDWIVPHLYGEPIFTKPPGMYIAIALCSWPFGEVTTWSARLPSALAAIAVVFLMYWYVRRQLNWQVGLLAALATPMTVLWLEKANAAEIDMLQTAWVVGSILFFLRALESHEEHPNARPWRWWLLSMMCMAGGVLTKWSAPVFLYTTMIALLWSRGRLRLLWCRCHIIAILAAAVLCLAWIAAVVYAEGWTVFYATVKSEALQRLAPNYHRPYPWHESLLHPLKILALTLPWSAVALATLRPRFIQLWDERGRRLIQAMHCWVWPNLIFWSLVAEHTPRHSFPIFPAVSVLGALGVWVWIAGKWRWPWRRIPPIRIFTTFMVIWLLLKTALVTVVVPRRDERRQVQAKGTTLASLVPFGETVFIFRLKDEGLMFYFGRCVLRLASAADLPSHGKPLYCILTENEWRNWNEDYDTEIVHRMTDAQGDPIVLIRLNRS